MHMAIGGVQLSREAECHNEPAPSEYFHPNSDFSKSSPRAGFHTMQPPPEATNESGVLSISDIPRFQNLSLVPSRIKMWTCPSMFGLRLASAEFFLPTRCFHGFPDLLRIGGGLMLVARKPIASVRKCHVYTITHLQSTNEFRQGDMVMPERRRHIFCMR
jgi:hypothetical protein